MLYQNMSTGHRNSSGIPALGSPGLQCLQALPQPQWPHSSLAGTAVGRLRLGGCMCPLGSEGVQARALPRWASPEPLQPAAHLRQTHTSSFSSHTTLRSERKEKGVQEWLEKVSDMVTQFPNSTWNPSPLFSVYCPLKRVSLFYVSSWMTQCHIQN